MPGAPVIDLFAGTHSVGYALASEHPIFANDIQAYSAVIGRAILAKTSSLPVAEELIPQLNITFSENWKILENGLAKWLEKEQLHVEKTNVDKKSLLRYRDFQNEFPFAGDLARGTSKKLQVEIARLISVGKGGGGAWTLFTTYFNNSYFSLRQAMEIDCYRRAIEELRKTDLHLFNVALACLMHACGYCTPGAGHFAQFRQLNSVAAYEDILRYRRRTISQYFVAKYKEFRERLTPAANSCDVDTMPYLEYLNKKKLPVNSQGIATIYADPPYSFVHYSRFYHLLETLVRYDYPACDHFGRYRDDRYQSGFCQTRHAPNEFRALAGAAFEKKMNLVISYADSALVPSAKLHSILCDAYGSNNVEVLKSDYLHATMGRMGDRHREVNEAAFICKYKMTSRIRSNF